MTRLNLKIAQLAAMVGLLIAGLGVSAALAGNGNGPPPAPPGQGECQHGNSGQECKPDPQPNRGQDCDEHGKQGGVNEDHCLGTSPTTTHETTTDHRTRAETTTTHETTTDHTTTSETTTPHETTTDHTTTSETTTPHETTTHETTTDQTTTRATTTTSATTTSPGPGTTTTPGSSGGAPAASVAPVAKPKHAVKARTAGVAVTNAAAQLPFTGFPAWILAIVGSVLLLAGLGIRRFASSRSGSRSQSI